MSLYRTGYVHVGVVEALLLGEVPALVRGEADTHAYGPRGRGGAGAVPSRCDYRHYDGAGRPARE